MTNSKKIPRYSNKQNYLPLSVLLNCNKIKAFKADQQKLVDAIRQSAALELKPDLTAVRRIGKKPIPDLKTLKRTKRDQPGVEVDPSIITDADLKEPHLFIITSQAKTATNWRDIEKKIKEASSSYKILYSRFSDCEGQLLISSVNSTKEDVKKLDALKVTVESNDFILSIPTKEQSEKFWTDHGSHFQMCMAKKITIAKKKMKSQMKRVKEDLTQKAKGPFVLGNITYEDINKVKSKARVILNTKKDGEELNEFEVKFIIDLLKYHKNGEAKLKDMKKVIVDSHPNFKATRCFFMVRADNSKEDFSIAKCIEDMIAKNAEVAK